MSTPEPFLAPPEPTTTPDPVAAPSPAPVPAAPAAGEVVDPTPEPASEPGTGDTSPGTASPPAGGGESDDELVARINATRLDPEPAPGVPVGAVTATGDVMRRRTDDDVLTGAFARVVDGPEAGRYVVVQQTVTTGEDGYPETVQVKTRDDRDELVVVNYADLRPASPGGR